MRNTGRLLSIAWHLRKAIWTKSQSGWDTAYETLDSFSPPRLGAVRGEAIKERAEIYKSVKNSFASSVAGIKGKIITSA